MKLKYWLYCTCLAVSAALGCAAAPEDSEEPVEVEVYRYAPEGGTQTREFLTLAELQAKYPEFVERATAPRVARQPIVDCATDNEDLTYAVSGDIAGNVVPWITNSLNWLIAELASVANTTGVVPRLLYPQIGTPDISFVSSTGSECVGSFGLTASLIQNGKRTQSTVKICRASIESNSSTYAGRYNSGRHTFLHETGHAMGLRHFTGNGTFFLPAGQAKDQYCQNATGVGATCPWGSKPGGRDTAMSYCAPIPTLQFDGCELEELYWLVGPGAELSGGSPSCPYSGI